MGNGRGIQTLWPAKSDRVLVLTSVHLTAYDLDGKLVWQAELGSPAIKMAFTPDGSVATLTAGGGVDLWDASTGKKLKTAFDPQEGTDQVDLSGSGGLLVTVDSVDQATAWDVANGASLGSANGGELESVIAAPDNASFWTNGFTSGGSQVIQAWDAKSGQNLRRLAEIGRNYVVEPSISADGKLIGGISRMNLSGKASFSLMVWDAASGKLNGSYANARDIEAYAFIPGQAKALFASRTSLSVLDLASFQVETSFDGACKGTTAQLVVSPDGKLLSQLCADGNMAVVDLAAKKSLKSIDLKTSQTVAPYILVGNTYLYHFQLYTNMAVDPKGQFVARLADNRMGVALIDPATQAVIRTVGKDPLNTFALSPDGTLVATADLNNTISIYKTTGAFVSAIQADNKNYIKMLEITADNQLVAALSGGNLGELYLWDIASGKKMPPFSGYNTMQFAPDGKRLVSDNVDFGLYVWDVASGKKIASPSADWILDLDYSPDGKTIAVAGFEVHSQEKVRQNLVTFYDTATNKLIPLTLKGHPAMISNIKYAPDGKLIATVDGQGNLCVWDAISGEKLVQISEAVFEPANLGWLPEGRTLVAGGKDGVLRFFEVR